MIRQSDCAKYLNGKNSYYLVRKSLFVLLCFAFRLSAYNKSIRSSACDISIRQSPHNTSVRSSAYIKSVCSLALYVSVRFVRR